jgi:hypothetical protein
MNIPDGLCLSTLKAIKGSGFSASARRHLWSGQKVPRVLPFSRETFQAFRGENAGRMSLSGVQEKISLRLSVGVLAPATAGGTHLLKPVPRAWAHTLELPHDVPANEHVTMQIAAQVFKMPVAACGLVFFPDGEPTLIVRRFEALPPDSFQLRHRQRRRPPQEFFPPREPFRGPHAQPRLRLGLHLAAPASRNTPGARSVRR